MILLIRGIFNVIMPACVLALIFLSILAWGPVHFDTSSIINQAGLQRTRVEVITNSTQRLGTPSDQNITTIARLQTALPMWEQEQARLARYPDPQIQAYLQEASSPYRLIDQAAHTILSEYSNKKPIDTTQIKIIQQYEQQYVVTMNNLVYYIVQQSELVNQWIATTQEVIIVLVAIAIVSKYVVLRKYVYPHLIALENAPKKKDHPDS